METLDERKESEEVELYNRLSKKLDSEAVKMKGLLLLLVAPLIVAGWGWDQKHEKVRLREVQVNNRITRSPARPPEYESLAGCHE